MAASALNPDYTFMYQIQVKIVEVKKSSIN